MTSPMTEIVAGSRRIRLEYASNERRQLANDSRLGSLPTGFDLHVSQPGQPSMRLNCRFGVRDGDRVEVTAVHFTGHPITATAIAHSRLGEVVRLGTGLAATAHWQWHGPTFPFVARQRREITGPIPADDLLLVASVYAFEHAAWGTPQIAVREALGLTEAAAHYWIGKAAARFGGLPGVGRAA